MLTDEDIMQSKITLPNAPADAWKDGVAVWEEPLEIDTYMPEEPDGYPAFLDRRVYQGSSGRVYPLPFHDRIAQEPTIRLWRAVHMENEYVRLVILPELGGRVHIAVDKTTGYDIFYRNNVIKPALVGLAGPWISGGIEFNWPQHHRPATFLPTEVSIEWHPGGAATVWCSDHDPFARMKGMHGVRLLPESSRIEVHARLYNRSELPQTFLWWANVAAAVNDDYQSFFPGDVKRVADHARRAVVSFPQPDAPYYGIDYAAQAGPDRPDADRLDWYRNIPVPTSYMALASAEDFFGGYDHGAHAGFVHVAPHEISPGKKQWTWGNAPFGWAWDRNLTDGDGPYVELMAGVYTDNQPDFAYLAAGETKTFTQVWHALRDIGPLQYADGRIAVSVMSSEAGTEIRLNASELLEDVTVAIDDLSGSELLAASVSVAPDRPQCLHVPPTISPLGRLEIRTAGDAPIQVPRESHTGDDIPEPARAVAPPVPSDVETVDELVHIAVYLDQYRHATRSSAPYITEALRRDPQESRALLLRGSHAYDRADYRASIVDLTASAAAGTRWTSTPVSGEAHYRLALALIRAAELPAAATALATAARDARYAVAARFALARLRQRQGRSAKAEELLLEATSIDPRHQQSLDLLAALAKKNGDLDATARWTTSALQADPLDAWAKHLAGEHVADDATILLDVALEYASAGFDQDARSVLDEADRALDAQPLGQVNVGPLLDVHRAALALRAGNREEATRWTHNLVRRDHRSAHPSRLDDVDALQLVCQAFPDAALPATMLGHWLHDKGRDADAANNWSTALATASAPALRAVLYRNLGLVAYNTDGDAERARSHYEAARVAAPRDAKLLFEQDLLDERCGASAEKRLARFESSRDLVNRRDDLAVSYANLLVDTGQPDAARSFIAGRRFQPWEGGEGQVLAVWDRANLAVARRALDDGRPEIALEVLAGSAEPPTRLGEGRHPLANVAALHLATGDALVSLGKQDAATRSWRAAADSTGTFVDMAERPYGIATFSAVEALERLGEQDAADELVAQMQDWVEDFATAPAQVDFFATSLPALLVFSEDPNAARDREVALVRRALLARAAARTVAESRG